MEHAQETEKNRKTITRNVNGKPSNGSSIEKALNILDAFLPYNAAISTTELSHRLGLNVSTVSRIMLTLAKKGYLRQDLQTKKYMLGPAVVRLGNSVNRALQSDLVPIAKPYIDVLRDLLGETVAFEIFTGTHSVMAYVASSSNPVRVAADVGEALPSHAAAGPKSILAFSPPEVRSRCLDGELTVYTPNTIVDRDELFRYLGKVKREGYAMDNGEIEVGVKAVAVPVFNHQETAVGAVVVVGPGSRIPGEDPETLINRIKETASQISAQLFHESSCN